MSSKTQSKYTTDFVPVKEIKNGMITTDLNEKVTGVKIAPRNINILDAGTQNAIISNLRTVYNIIDYEFWLIIADRPVDINVYISQLQLLYNQTSSNVKRKMILEDINKATMFINENVVDTEFFLLFKDKNIEKVGKKIRDLIQAFANAGLNATQTSDEDLRVILDNFLNGGSSTKFGAVMSE